MNNDQKLQQLQELAMARYTIAICKQEIEKVIPAEVMQTLDNGSAWGRAYIRICKELKDEQDETIND